MWVAPAPRPPLLKWGVTGHHVTACFAVTGSEEGGACDVSRPTLQKQRASVERLQRSVRCRQEKNFTTDSGFYY